MTPRFSLGEVTKGEGRKRGGSCRGWVGERGGERRRIRVLGGEEV